MERKPYGNKMKGNPYGVKQKEDPTTWRNEKKILWDEWKGESYGEDEMEHKGSQKGYEQKESRGL